MKENLKVMFLGENVGPKERKKEDVIQVFNTYMCSGLKDQDVRTLLLALIQLEIEKDEDLLVGVLGVLGVFGRERECREMEGEKEIVWCCLQLVIFQDIQWINISLMQWQYLEDMLGDLKTRK